MLTMIVIDPQNNTWESDHEGYPIRMKLCQRPEELVLYAEKNNSLQGFKTSKKIMDISNFYRFLKNDLSFRSKYESTIH